MRETSRYVQKVRGILEDNGIATCADVRAIHQELTKSQISAAFAYLIRVGQATRVLIPNEPGKRARKQVWQYRIANAETARQIEEC